MRSASKGRIEVSRPSRAGLIETSSEKERGRSAWGELVTALGAATGATDVAAGVAMGLGAGAAAVAGVLPAGVGIATGCSAATSCGAGAGEDGGTGAAVCVATGSVAAEFASGSLAACGARVCAAICSRMLGMPDDAGAGELGSSWASGLAGSAARAGLGVWSASPVSLGAAGCPSARASSPVSAATGSAFSACASAVSSTSGALTSAVSLGCSGPTSGSGSFLASTCRVLGLEGLSAPFLRFQGLPPLPALP